MGCSSPAMYANANDNGGKPGRARLLNGPDQNRHRALRSTRIRQERPARVGAQQLQPSSRRGRRTAIYTGEIHSYDLGHQLDHQLDGAMPAAGMNPAATFGVVELRRYALHPGGRDVLIPLFEREFIERQESCGMVPIGHYRDLDDPNSFVWFRGFADMETRRGALEAFYTSPAWMDHRDAANATMIDSDNVLLLRCARPATGFDPQSLTRP